jgi:hypothetical protein
VKPKKTRAYFPWYWASVTECPWWSVKENANLGAVFAMVKVYALASGRLKPIRHPFIFLPGGESGWSFILCFAHHGPIHCVSTVGTHRFWQPGERTSGTNTPSYRRNEEGSQQLTFIMFSPFRVIKHSVNAQHIREYPAATAGRQEDVLQLAVKQYVPLSHPDPQPGDLSIIGAHANGFPKELYEPPWAEIYHRLKAKGITIRGIWIADAAHQGQSGVVNEAKLGNDRNKHLLLLM